MRLQKCGLHWFLAGCGGGISSQLFVACAFFRLCGRRSESDIRFGLDLIIHGVGFLYIFIVLLADQPREYLGER